MHKKREGWSVVLAGFWNRMIFTPEWVGPRLFDEDDQLETVVALLPVLPIIYRDDQVAIEISSQRIVCRARNLESDVALLRTGEIACKVLQDLPETPVQGVGVNFAFREQSPNPYLLGLFDLEDDSRWGQNGWEIGQRKIVRQLIKNGDTLNLTFTLSDDVLDIDCNYHTEADDNEVLRSALMPERVIQLRDQVINELRDLYDLEMEESDDNA